ncbi:hypothetical protein KQX54_014899 [Cotesia glomerata]|uniref:Uncharacterized protein n=1 Tax=Cotesia glomerata TaxID=32391 RepID=A0AAV7IYR8_COTGL|nr:hypothetical protein KQX54_014899 [Cotesia glomerata]
MSNEKKLMQLRGKKKSVVKPVGEDNYEEVKDRKNGKRWGNIRLAVTIESVHSESSKLYYSRSKMPTCTCENLSQDEIINHVCQMKIISDCESDSNENEFGGLKKLESSVRYSDGSVRLRNPNIELMDQDILYHLALGSGSHDLVEMFGDIKVQ